MKVQKDHKWESWFLIKIILLINFPELFLKIEAQASKDDWIMIHVKKTGCGVRLLQNNFKNSCWNILFEKRETIKNEAL